MEFKHLLICIVASELLSAFLLIKVWKARDYLFFKVAYTLLLPIPFLGPVFYFISSSRLTVQDNKFQNRESRYNNLWGWGAYTDRWQRDKEAMQKKIEELEKDQ